MKTIGLIGGMSWESTLAYYRIINEVVRRELGGLHSAKILLSSVDFAVVEAFQRQERWGDVAELLSREAARLEAAGADFLLLCSNTVHKVAEEVGSAISIPILHISDSLSEVLQASLLSRVLLLGTRYTLESDFLTNPLEEAGFSLLLPNNAQSCELNRIIFEELCRGILTIHSRKWLEALIVHYKGEGAQGVILACTELSLILKEESSILPLYDTTRIHAEKAGQYALRL